MSKIFFYITLFILAALQSKAAGLFIEVKNKQTNTSIQDAELKLQFNGQSFQFKTDSTGKIFLNTIQFPIQLNFSKLGYKRVSRKLTQEQVTLSGADYVYIIYVDQTLQQIQEVVVTGQITPVLANQSIYKVNTISTTQITQRGAVNLSDVLSYELNNFISNDNILGSSVSVGGIGGQNVKVLINGIPVMGRENGNIDLGQLNMNNIKRVEMIQGPMSVMYGSNALGGVINLITNSPSKKFSVNLRSYNESIGRFNQSGNFNFSKKKHQLQISLARNFFAGWAPKDSIDRFQLWKPKTQYTSDVQYNLMVNEKIKLSYFGSYLNEKITNKGIPIVNPYEGYAFDEYYRTSRLINSVNGDIKLSNKEQLNLTNSYSIYHRTKNRFKKDLVSLGQFETKSVGDQDTSIFNTINLRGTLSSSRVKNVDALIGYELTDEVGQSFKLANEQQRMTDLGLFSSILIRYRHFSLQPSFRVTYNSRYNPGYTPAFHAKYDLNKATQFRASYAKGFRAPSLKELHLQFIDQNHTILGNPDLKPETGHHLEFGIYHQKSVGKGNLTLSLNTYQNSIQKMITLAVYNSQGILRIYENIEHYSNWITSFQAKYKTSKLSLNCGVGYTYVNESNIVPQHAIFEFGLNGSYLFSKLGTSINMNYKYNSKQPVITVDEQFLYTAPIHAANVSLQRKFFKNAIQLQLGVKNIFNIQNTILSGAVNSQGSAHSNSAGMQVFPARSVFLDVNYCFQ
jgi:outer membrane receptor for ferrienterochelin and colicins